MRREEMLRELGLAPLWRLRERAFVDSEAVAAEASADAARSSAEAGGAPKPVADASSEARGARIARLDHGALVIDIASCTACALAATRKRTVPGVGDVRAEWMFVGEAPGADEDAQGEPFVGVAGQLLDNMLAALGLSRSKNVYIANVLKCRPPNNRAPEPAEAQACAAYLERQIELISPRLIVALGKSAASHLLHTDAPVASLRHRVHRYRNTALVVTYHPAYLLRNPADKARAWEDLLFARHVLRER